MTEAKPSREMAPPVAQSPSILARIASQAGEFFLLREQMALVARRAFAEGCPGWAEFALGRAALSDAHQLADAREGAGTALLLYRSAALLFARAHIARGQAAGGEPQGAADPMQAAPLRAELAALPTEQRALVEQGLAADGAARCANMPEPQRRLSLTGLRTIAQALGDTLEAEARPIRRVRAVRGWRIGLALAVALIGMSWTVSKLAIRTNLARGKSVVVTSAEPRVRARPRSLVDGNRLSLGFHTRKLKDQSATIDLGEARVIHSVEIYNRVDCCQDRAVPLRVELSVDGVEYTTVERQTQTFRSWKVLVPELTARFVRVSHEGTNFFHLAEVEVY